MDNPLSDAEKQRLRDLGPVFEQVLRGGAVGEAAWAIKTHKAVRAEDTEVLK